jgi:hypothetical protein
MDALTEAARRRWDELLAADAASVHAGGSVIPSIAVGPKGG